MSVVQLQPSRWLICSAAVEESIRTRWVRSQGERSMLSHRMRFGQIEVVTLETALTRAIEVANSTDGVIHIVCEYFDDPELALQQALRERGISVHLHAWREDPGEALGSLCTPEQVVIEAWQSEKTMPEVRAVFGKMSEDWADDYRVALTDWSDRVRQDHPEVSVEHFGEEATAVSQEDEEERQLVGTLRSSAPEGSGEEKPEEPGAATNARPLGLVLGSLVAAAELLVQTASTIPVTVQQCAQWLDALRADESSSTSSGGLSPTLAYRSEPPAPAPAATGGPFGVEMFSSMLSFAAPIPKRTLTPGTWSLIRVEPYGDSGLEIVLTTDVAAHGETPVRVIAWSETGLETESPSAALPFEDEVENAPIKIGRGVLALLYRGALFAGSLHHVIDVHPLPAGVRVAAFAGKRALWMLQDQSIVVMLKAD